MFLVWFILLSLNIQNLVRGFEVFCEKTKPIYEWVIWACFGKPLTELDKGIQMVLTHAGSAFIGNFFTPTSGRDVVDDCVH